MKKVSEILKEARYNSKVASLKVSFINTLTRAKVRNIIDEMPSEYKKDVIINSFNYNSLAILGPQNKIMDLRDWFYKKSGILLIREIHLLLSISKGYDSHNKGGVTTNGRENRVVIQSS